MVLQWLINIHRRFDEFMKSQTRRRRGYFIIPFLITAALSVGASYIAAALSRNKKPKFQFDKQRTTLSDKGSFVQLVMGRQRVAPVFVWAGKRFVNQHFTGPVYHERGFHALCVGPAYALRRIWMGETIIFDQLITRDDTPSGSLFHCKDRNVSKFRVYWGQCDQPIDTKLAGYMGVHSRWPHVCYIAWDTVSLPGQAIWPQIEYDIEVRPLDLNWDFPFTPWIPPTDADGIVEGPNPVAALWQVITAEFPHGCGIQPDAVNDASIVELGTVLSTDPEILPVNMLIPGGTDASDVIANILTDVGMTLPQVGGELVPYLVRTAAGDLPVLSPDVTIDPRPEIKRQHGPIGSDRLTIHFPDKEHAFAVTTRPLSSDGEALLNRRPNRTDIQFSIANDLTSAYKMGFRRQQELRMSNQVYASTFTREARRLFSGQLFVWQGLGIVRITGVSLQTKKYTAKLDTVLEVYSGSAVDAGFPGEGEPPVDPESDVAADLQFEPIFVPEALKTTANDVEFWVPRVRANETIVGAAVWISSASSGVYNSIGNQDAAAIGGLLTSGMDDNVSELPIGPTFSVVGPDIDSIQDLTGNDDAYNSGAQILLIDQEYMLLRGVTALVTDYELDGITRGAFGTVVAEHAIGAKIYIFNAADMTHFTTTLLEPGGTVYLKTQPFNTTQLVDITTVTPEPLFYPGLPTDPGGGELTTCPEGAQTLSSPVGNMTTALQAAVLAAASAPVKVVCLGPGTYSIGSSVQIPSGVTVFNADGTAILTPLVHGQTILSLNGVSSIRLDGLVFDGGPVIVQGGTNGVTIENCTFKNSTIDQGFNDSSLFMVDISNIAIKFCRFQNNDGDANIWIFTADHITVTRCRFVDCAEPIHMVNGKVGASDFFFTFNHITGGKRAGMELQDTYNDASPQVLLHNVNVTDNYIAEWRTPADFPCGLSVPLQAASGVLVARNFIADMNWGIEACGENYVIDGNIVIDTNVMICMDGHIVNLSLANNTLKGTAPDTGSLSFGSGRAIESAFSWTGITISPSNTYLGSSGFTRPAPPVTGPYQQGAV